MTSCDMDSSFLSFPHPELVFSFWLRTGIIGTPSLPGQAAQDLGRFTSANTFGHWWGEQESVCRRGLLFREVVDNTLPCSCDVNPHIFGRYRWNQQKPFTQTPCRSNNTQRTFTFYDKLLGSLVARSMTSGVRRMFETGSGEGHEAPSVLCCERQQSADICASHYLLCVLHWLLYIWSKSQALCRKNPVQELQCIRGDSHT